MTVLSAAAGCPAFGGVPSPRDNEAGQSDVVSSVLMSPFLMCLLLMQALIEFRMETWPFLYRLHAVDLPCHWLVGRFGRCG